MVTVTHAFNVGIADDPKAAAAGEVLPSHWNAAHTITGTIRDVLTADRNYYIRSDGSDANTGTANTAAGAWLTLQHAINFVQSNIDFAGLQVTVNVGAGTFAGGTVTGFVGGGFFQVQGAGSANTTINYDGVSFGIFVANNATDTIVAIDAVTIDLLNSAYGIYSSNVGITTVGQAKSFSGSDIVFKQSAGGPSEAACVFTTSPGLIFIAQGNFVVQAMSMQSILNPTLQGQIQDYGTWTVKGAVTVSQGFCWADASGDYAGVLGTYALGVGGSVTGPRFLVTNNSNVSGAQGTILGLTFFPGSTAGICDASSTYDQFIMGTSIVGKPTTTNLPNSGSFGMFKDTSGGGVYIAYNDAGTIKATALSSTF